MGEPIQVGGLIQYIFSDAKLPLKINDALISHLPGIFKDSTFSALEERDLAEGLNKAGAMLMSHVESTCPGPKTLLNQLRIWERSSATALAMKDASEQKPCLLLRDFADSANKSLESIRVVCDVNTEPDLSTWNMDALIKWISIIVQNQPNRRFIFGLSMSKKDFFLTLFDHSGIWVSEKHSIKNDALLLYRALAGCMLCSLSDIGYDPTVECFQNKPVWISHSHTVDPRRITRYRVLKILSISGEIVGRATVCYLVCLGDNFYVINDSWVDISQEFTEFDILAFIKDKGIKSVPNLIAGSFVYVDGEVDRTADFIPKGAGNISSPHQVHIRLVLTPIGNKITEFASKEELLSVLIDVVHGETSGFL